MSCKLHWTLHIIIVLCGICQIILKIQKWWFFRGKSWNIPKFIYNGLSLQVVTDYRYLGIDFTYNGKCIKSKRYLFEQVHKAMYSLLRKQQNLCLPIDVQLHFVPILLYRSGLWGCENNYIVEKLQIKFCHIILGVKNTTSKCMVYGELGLQTSIDQTVLNFWANVVNANDKKFSKTLYLVMYKLNKTTKQVW